MNVTLARPATRRTENIFFTGISLVMLAIAAVGFAPSYFLKGAVFALALCRGAMCGCIENWAHWALILDLFTWKRPLLVTILGGWILWGFDPIPTRLSTHRRRNNSHTGRSTTRKHSPTQAAGPSGNARRLAGDGPSIMVFR